MKMMIVKSVVSLSLLSAGVVAITAVPSGNVAYAYRLDELGYDTSECL